MKNDDGVTKKVVVFFGLIASGKSFVAQAWAQKHSFPYSNTDVVRKQLAGIHPNESRRERMAEGIYSPAFTRMTYDALLGFAEEALDDPSVFCVVLDGSYQARAERERMLTRIEPRAQVIFVMCCCREETIKARLLRRAIDPAAVSDGSWEIYLKQKETFESPEELLVRQLRRLDTEQTIGAMLRSLDSLLRNEKEYTSS